MAPLAKSGGGGDSGDMETRVARLEQGLGRIETTLAVMNEKLSHLATKAELSDHIGTVNTALAGKPGTGAMWLMGIALFGLVIAALALVPVVIPAIQALSHR